MTLPILFANLGFFLAFALRKQAVSPKGIVPVGSQKDITALEPKKRRKSFVVVMDDNMIGSQQEILKSEKEDLAARSGDTLVDNVRGRWSKVQIWGWVAQLEDTHEQRIWGLTDSSGYLPEELEEEDPKLDMELKGFLAFKNYEAWLVENRQSFGGDAHTDVYSPFVVVDGSYVGGYQGFAKAIAENYPDLSAATGGPIG